MNTCKPPKPTNNSTPSWLIKTDRGPAEWLPYGSKICALVYPACTSMSSPMAVSAHSTMPIE